MRKLNNSVQLIGNLGKDAKIIDLEGGKAMVVFSIATTDKFTNEIGQKVEDTQWHDCTLFRADREKAENIAQYLVKGTRLLVEGQLKHRQTKGMVGPNKDVEATFTNTTVRVNDLEFLSSKKVSGEESEEPVSGSVEP